MENLKGIQIIIDIICIIIFAIDAIIEESTGYAVASIYAFVALVAHINNLRHDDHLY